VNKKRIIAAIDIANGKAVKSVKFVDTKEVGDPVELAKRYAEQGADEITFLDIMASHEGRGTFFSLIERAARDLPVLISIAGGIRTVDDFRRAIDYGADKVSVTSAIVANPGLITEASEAIGKEKVVVAIDSKRVGDNYHVIIKGGREDTGLDLLDWAVKCESLGAGEFVINSIDGDGTRQGYDIPMTKAVMGCVNIPVTASGGCGQISHVIDVFKQTNCDSALVASLLHYGIATVKEIKQEMERNGI
jgi:cyclase